jgi:hypothetical protein
MTREGRCHVRRQDSPDPGTVTKPTTTADSTHKIEPSSATGLTSTAPIIGDRNDGQHPVTRASGKSRHVMTRKVKNQRLAAVGYVWAFSALSASPGARAHYDRRRENNERHTAAQRNLFNRLIGVLHHCLQTGQKYEEQKAFKTISTTALAAAA